MFGFETAFRSDTKSASGNIGNSKKSSNLIEIAPSVTSLRCMSLPIEFVFFGTESNYQKNKPHIRFVSLPIHVLWFIWETYLSMFTDVWYIFPLPMLFYPRSNSTINSLEESSTFFSARGKVCKARRENVWPFGIWQSSGMQGLGEKGNKPFVESNEWPLSKAWKIRKGVNLMIVC